MRTVTIAMLGVLLAGCEESAAAVTVAVPSPTRSAAPPPPPPSCPEGMVKIESFCIDRWEAHLVSATDPSSEHSAYERPRASERYAARSTNGSVPQAYVSRLEADAACTNAGKRLCRAREWRRACVGPKETRYPYGDTLVKGRCNVDKGHLPIKVFGRNVPLTYDLHYNSPRLNQQPGFLAKTAEYAGCESADGVFDLVGNLHEWVADDVSSRLGKEIPIPYGDHLVGPKGSGVFMGGYFSSHGEHGKGCSYVTTNHAPDYHDYSIGFRCCADPSSRSSAP